jgi:tetrahydromethanopterin S-methyltransferase subunit C
MSVAGGGGGESAVNPKTTMAIGIIGGLVGLYGSAFIPVIGPVFAALAAVCAIIWGADAIARVASYGLGTGVPSIGYMSVAIGIIGAVGGLIGFSAFGLVGMELAAPIFGIILAMIVGALVALVGKLVIKMKIPVLVSCTAELAGASAIAVMGFSAAIAGSLSFAAIQSEVISTGFIALLFILSTMAIQHPFNACLGPQENRVRTLKLAGATAFMSMAIVGLLGMATVSSWWVIALVGALGWFVSMSMFLKASAEEAASVAWTGWWPKEEEH